MRTFKRLFATLTAGFDGFIDPVENHAAVAEDVVADVRRQAPRSNVQRELTAVEDKLNELQMRKPCCPHAAHTPKQARLRPVWHAMKAMQRACSSVGKPK